jgi:hypothetical protein
MSTRLSADSVTGIEPVQASVPLGAPQTSTLPPVDDDDEPPPDEPPADEVPPPAEVAPFPVVPPLVPLSEDVVPPVLAAPDDDVPLPDVDAAECPPLEVPEELAPLDVATRPVVPAEEDAWPVDDPVPDVPDDEAEVDASLPLEVVPLLEPDALITPETLQAHNCSTTAQPSSGFSRFTFTARAYVERSLLARVDS